MRRGKAIGVALAALLMGVVAVSLGWSVARGAAEDETGVGRYQVAAPDLVLDTATGRLVTAKGEVLETPIDASGKEAGRFAVAGYVSAVTRGVGLNIFNQPTVSQELVKGYVIADTKTGRIMRSRQYHARPFQEGDL